MRTFAVRGPRNLRPIGDSDLKYFGIPYWVEVKGYDEIQIGYSGDFASAICKITGKTRLIDSMRYKARYWEIGHEPPTKEELAAALW